MTNTLHRFGAPETFSDDYIVFAMVAREINDVDAPAKLQEFLRLSLKHHPINFGNSLKGAMYQASPSLTPLVHWRRKDGVDPEEVVKGIDSCTTVAAVFDQPAGVEALLLDLRRADLGISINISSLTEGTGLLSASRDHSAQRLLFPGVSRRPEPAARSPDPGALHHVRPRDDLSQPGEEDDGDGEGGTAHSPAGRSLYGPLLHLWCLQSLPGRAHFRGSAGRKGTEEGNRGNLLERGGTDFPVGGRQQLRQVHDTGLAPRSK